MEWFRVLFQNNLDFLVNQFYNSSLNIFFIPIGFFFFFTSDTRIYEAGSWPLPLGMIYHNWYLLFVPGNETLMVLPCIYVIYSHLSWYH